MKTSLLLAAAALLGSLSGCLLNDRSNLIVKDKPYYTTVDAGETLSTELGKGAAAFVEYQRGGRWRLWTSCDTKVTGLMCRYQITVAPRAALGSITAVDLEASDSYERYSDGTFTFFAETGIDRDAIEFTTKPGALIDVELILDGSVDPQYLVWYGNGRVHEGAPRSPVVFQPDAP